MDYTISFKYSKWDCFDIVCDSLLDIFKFRVTFILLLALLLGLSGVLFIFQDFVIEGTLLLIISILYFPFVFLVQYIFTCSSLKSTPHMICVLMKDNNLKVMNVLGEKIVPLKKIHSILIAPKTINVCLDENTAFIIPKRAFINLEAAEAFAMILEEKFKQSKLN